MSVVLPALIEEEFVISERIAAQDLNNLYLTSRFFEDRLKYLGFCGLYALMRVIDDRIDDIPDRQKLTAADRQREHAIVDAWAEALDAATRTGAASPEQIAACDHIEATEILSAAASAMRTFPVPWSLWTNFFAAMHEDIEQARFVSYADFLSYTEGASVAPTSIYLVLIASRRGTDAAPDGKPYLLPAEFQIIECGRALGTFAYLGHILRDLAADLATGDRGLLYVAADDLARHGVSEAMLFEDLSRQRARHSVRQLVSDLIVRARHHVAEGRRLMQPVMGHLTPDCAYILELIVTIYERVILKLEAQEFDPMGDRHLLTLDEKQHIAADVARRVGYGDSD